MALCRAKTKLEKKERQQKNTFLKYLLYAALGAPCVIYSAQWWCAMGIIIPTLVHCLILLGLTDSPGKVVIFLGWHTVYACILIQSAWV